MKTWISFAIKIAISAALIWMLLRGVDIDDAWQRVAAAKPLPLLAALALMFVQVVVVAFRWKIILNAVQAVLSFALTFRYFYISVFFNQTLPASVGGDAVRVYKAHKAGVGLGPAINSVMLDRLAALIGVVVMMAVSLPVLFSLIDQPAARLGLGATVGLSLAVLAVLAVLDRLPASLHRWRVVRGLAALAADTRRIFLSPQYTPSVMGVTIFGHINLALSVWALSLSLDLNVTVIDCMVLFPPVLLISSLPISIAGWGVREGAMVAAFGFVGVPADGALVLSILFGLWMMIASLPGGLVWLADRGNTALESVPADTKAD